MAIPARHIIAILGALCLSGLAGCADQASDRLDVIIIGEADDPFETGVRLSPAGQMVRAATREGLVAIDAEGRVVPALADRWIITDDGLSYIFRLRDGTWRDGDEITGEAARRSFREAVRALEGTAFGLDLGTIDEVRAMAGRVLEIRLTRPVPDFLQLLAQPEMGLSHEGEGTGPMELAREGETARLVAIPPDEVGLPEIPDWDQRTRPVYLTATTGEEAIARFNAGEADLVLGGRIQDFPRTSAVGILRGTIQPDPVTGLFGLKVMRPRGFLADAINREALSMAIHREELLADFGIDGWVPSNQLVPTDLTDGAETIGERWSALTLEQRQQVAASRVARWRDNEGEGELPSLATWLPEGPGSDLLFKRLQDDLALVGIVLERADKAEGADLRLVDSVARYPSASWFLNRMNCAIWKAVCDSRADRLVREANAIPNDAVRSEQLADAEELLTEANGFIPFGPPIRWSLARSDVAGFAINASGWHPLMPLAAIPR